VTGSHNIKVGFNHQCGYETSQIEAHGDTSVLIYTTSAPACRHRVRHVLSTPYTRQENLNANLGVFAQDKWTLKRLTLTYGARYDYFNASTPQQSAVAGRFMSAAADGGPQVIAPVECLPVLERLAIRGGASYDLFGTGKTALKLSVGKFLGQQALGLATNTNPLAGQNDTRQWIDRDGNNTIFDAQGIVQFNELGVTANNNFGIPGIGSTQFDPALPRPTNWEESVSVQHQLTPRLSVTGGYYHRSFQHIQYTKNTLIDPVADYQAFTIIAPANANLPNGGGQSITVYNLNPTKRGIVNNVLTWSDNNSRVYNGVEFSANARLATRRVPLRRGDDGAHRCRQLRGPGELEPEQPALLPAGAAVPDAVQGVGRLHHPVGCSVQRHVPSQARHQHRVDLHVQQRASRLCDHRRRDAQRHRRRSNGAIL
jgi:hypothetical protein